VDAILHANPIIKITSSEGVWLKALCGNFIDGIRELICWKNFDKILQLFSELCMIHAYLVPTERLWLARVSADAMALSTCDDTAFTALVTLLPI
jgi:hypothetical protein